MSEDKKDEDSEARADSAFGGDEDLNVFSEALDDFFEGMNKPVPSPERGLTDFPGPLSLTREQREAHLAALVASGKVSEPDWDQLDPKYTKIMAALKRASRRPSVFHLRAILEATSLRGITVLRALLKVLKNPAPIQSSQQDAIFRSSVGHIVDPMQAELASVYLLDNEGTAHMTHVFYSRSIPKAHRPSVRAFDRVTIPKGSGLIGVSVRSKSSLLTRSKLPLNVAGGCRPVHSVLTVPIVDRFGSEKDWQVFGAIQVINKTAEGGGAFSGADLDLMDAIGGYLARLVHLIRDPTLVRSTAELTGYRYHLSALREAAPRAEASTGSTNISANLPTVTHCLPEVRSDVAPGTRAFLLAEELGMDVADFATLKIAPDVIAKIPKTFAETYCVCPIGFEDDVLIVAMANPRNDTILEDLRFMLNLQVRGAVSTPPSISRAIKRYYGDAKAAEIEALAKRKLTELEAAGEGKLAEIRAERQLLAEERAQLAEERAQLAEERILAPAHLIMSAVDGELPPEESADLEDRLAGTDALARAEWAWLQRVSQALGCLELDDPPPETLSRLADFVSGLPDSDAS